MSDGPKKTLMRLAGPEDLATPEQRKTFAEDLADPVIDAVQAERKRQGLAPLTETDEATGRFILRKDGTAIIESGDICVTVGPEGVVIRSPRGTYTIGSDFGLTLTFPSVRGKG